MGLIKRAKNGGYFSHHYSQAQALFSQFRIQLRIFSFGCQQDSLDKTSVVQGKSLGVRMPGIVPMPEQALPCLRPSPKQSGVFQACPIMNEQWPVL